jgi:hypothetical protein
MEEGKPTGITRADIEGLRKVQFEGQQAQLFHRGTEAPGGVEYVTLGLDIGGTQLVLYGYFRDSEFMEVDRKRLD